MKVELKRSNGWKIKPKDVEDYEDVDYAVVHESRIKKVGVLVRGPDNFSCSKCDSSECSHIRAVRDRMPQVTA